jgi:3-oxoacid CoA-transferase subunit A
MYYITGDKHGDFRRAVALCYTVSSTIDDVLIVLGDAGINYFGDENDKKLKRMLAQLPITFFCLHGNHELRPETIGYDETEWNNGTVFLEPEFPNLLFAKDGEIYNLEGRNCIAIGGAYSVDKPYRLANGYGWWPDEQPSLEIKRRVESRLEAERWKIDVVLSHTCPMKYMPYEAFIPGIAQEDVDTSTETWLDYIEDKLEYKIWYCGHYHLYKVIDKMRFLFDDFLRFF